MNLPIPIFRNEINALGDFKGGVKVARDFAVLMALAFPLRRLEMLDGGGRRGADRRRQRGGEDEARRVGAHRVDQLGRAGDVAAEAAERLGQGTLDDINPMRRIVALGDAAAARAVHADRVHFVDIGHRVVFVGEIADRVDRRDVAVHRIEALEDDQLGPRRIGGLQQFLEMRDVIVPPDHLVAAGLPHALDHRIVVERVRQDQAVRQELGDGRNAGLVRDVARCEQKCGFLAVQVGEFALQLDQRMVGAGDVAGAAGAGAHAGGDVDHGADHLRVLGHAEIIVGTPDDDVALAFGRVPMGVREPAGDALEIGENAISALVAQFIQRRHEEVIVIHK